MVSYDVIFRLERKLGWTVTVPALSACQAQGSSIDQARERIRAVIAACERVPVARVELREERLTVRFDRALERVRRKRERAERTAKESADETRLLAIKLVCSMTVRDAAELLGLSHGRVQQLVG